MEFKKMVTKPYMQNRKRNIDVQKLFQLILLGCFTGIMELSWVDFFKKRFVWVLSFIIDEKNIFPVSSPLGICSTGAKSPGARGSGVQGSGAHVPLQGIQGGSVLFHVIKKQEAQPEEVSWGFDPESNYSVLLRVHRGANTPTWVNPQDKYQQKVHVPNILSLKIENLTCEDSGHYRARVSFPGGLELTQVFRLTVYGKWHLLTPLHDFPPSFVLGGPHRPPFCKILFRPQPSDCFIIQ